MTDLATQESAVDASAIRLMLHSYGIPDDVIRDLIGALPRTALGVILYGSQARLDAGPDSDIDLLVVSVFHERTRAVGRVNVSTYDDVQFSSARGTMFGMHLARDGILIHDAGGVRTVLDQFGPIDEDRLWSRLTRLSTLLSLPGEEKAANLAGFVRHARYVLRTATYARALRERNPCFSVSELAERYDDPDLNVLLSSHPKTQGPPTTEVLAELTSRIRDLLGDAPVVEYSHLADLIVGAQLDEPDIADAAILILDRRDDGPYTEIPRVIL